MRSITPTLALFIYAGLAGCAPPPASETAPSLSSAIVPFSDPFGSHFQVNGSTSPSVVSHMGYVNLEVVGGSGITAVNFYDGTTFVGGVSAPSQSYQLLVDERSNGNHAYSAKIFTATTNGTSSTIPLTISISGGQELAYQTSFNGLDLTGSYFNAVTTRASDGSMLFGGQSLLSGTMVSMIVDTHPNGDFDLQRDSRESSWNAVAVDPHTGLRATAGWAVNNGQRDLVVVMTGPPSWMGPFPEKFHIEYDAAGLDDEANAIAISAKDGSVVVGGFEERPGEGKNGWLTKYDANGNSLWTQTINAYLNRDDVITSIALDPHDDSVVVGGYTTAAVMRWVGRSRRLVHIQVGFVSVYDSNGNQRWQWLDMPDGLISGAVQSVALSPRYQVVFGGWIQTGTQQSRVGYLQDVDGFLMWTQNLSFNNNTTVAVGPIDDLYVSSSYGPTPINPGGNYPRPWMGKLDLMRGGPVWQQTGVYGAGITLDLASSPPRLLLAGGSQGVPFVATYTP
jgi:hypothetical protein